jgi:hypothetical protein
MATTHCVAGPHWRRSRIESHTQEGFVEFVELMEFVELGRVGSLESLVESQKNVLEAVVDLS